jgi:HEAT repeat protein
MELVRCSRLPGWLRRSLLGLVAAVVVCLPGPVLAAEGQGKPAEPGDEVPELFKKLGPNTAEARDAWKKLYKNVGPKDLDAVLLAAQDKSLHVNARTWAVNFFARFAKMPEETIKKRIIPVLLDLLRDKNIHVRRAATSVAACYAGHSTSVVDRLIQLTEEEDWPKDRVGVAELAVSSLGGAYPKDKRAYPFLVELSKTGPDDLRWRAIRSLGMLGQIHRSAVRLVLPELIAIARDTTRSDQDRGAAIGGLGYMGPKAKDAMPTLRQLLKDPQVCEPAYALGMTLGILEVFRLMGPAAKDAVPDLIKFAEDSKRTRDERVMAIVALGAIGPDAKSAIPALTKILESAKKGRKSPDAEFGTSADRALKQIKKE